MISVIPNCANKIPRFDVPLSLASSKDSFNRSLTLVLGGCQRFSKEDVKPVVTMIDSSSVNFSPGSGRRSLSLIHNTLLLASSSYTRTSFSSSSGIPQSPENVKLRNGKIIIAIATIAVTGTICLQPNLNV